MNPKISVIMSVYNGEPYLKQSIESILCQTFEDFEFIIINDGSTDNSWEIIQVYAEKDSRIVPLAQKNIGLTKSLNKGLQRAQGEYIARQDADDISFENRLEKQIRYFNKDKEIVLIGSSIVIDGPYGKRIYYSPETLPMIRWKILFNNCFNHPTIMFKREILDREKLFYGKFNNSISDVSFLNGPAQDYLFIGKIAFKYKVANLREPLVLFRKHNKSISNVKKRLQRQNAILISKYFIESLIGKQITSKQIDIYVHPNKMLSLSRNLHDGVVSDFQTIIRVFNNRYNNSNSWIIHRQNMHTIYYNYFYSSTIIRLLKAIKMLYCEQSFHSFKLCLVLIFKIDFKLNQSIINYLVSKKDKS